MEYKLITNVIFPKYNENEELWEMAKCGETEDGLVLIIWTNDPGWIPHFHILNNSNPKKATFDACLKIETPEYFKHGHHTDILNSKQMKHVIKLLNTIIPTGITRWQHLISNWNDNNSEQTVPYDLPIPDYMSLIKQREH